MKRQSPLVAIFLIVAVDVLGFTIILPLLPFYAQTFGASPLVVGILATTYAACQFLSGPFLGRISDKYGRKPILMLSQAGTLAGFILLGVAQSLPMIFLSRIIDGVTAGNLTIAQAAIADVTPPEGRAKAFGVIGIAFGLGFILGPAISAALSHFDVHYPAYAAAGLSALSIVATWFLLPAARERVDSSENAKSATRLFGFFQRPLLRWLLVEFLIFGFIFSGFTSGFAMFAERRFTWQGQAFGPREVSLLFTYSGFLGLVLQGFLLGRLVKAFGEAKLVAAGFASMTIGYFILSRVDSVGGLVLASTIGSFGTGVIRPALTSLVSRTAGPREQGAALGATQSLMSIGQIAAPLLSGYIIGHSAVEPMALAYWGWWLAGMAAAGLAIRQLFSRKAVATAAALVMSFAFASAPARASASALRPECTIQLTDACFDASVALVVRNGAGGIANVCTGVALDQQTVLTAAHCLKSFSKLHKTVEVFNALEVDANATPIATADLSLGVANTRYDRNVSYYQGDRAWLKLATLLPADLNFPLEPTATVWSDLTKAVNGAAGTPSTVDLWRIGYGSRPTVAGGRSNMRTLVASPIESVGSTFLAMRDPDPMPGDSGGPLFQFRVGEGLYIMATHSTWNRVKKLAYEPRYN